MKLFKWMQNKFSGGQCNGVPDVVDPVSASYGKRLLSIGTLGNQKVPENQDNRRPAAENPETNTLYEDENLSPDLTDFTPEEIGKLQKNLTKLLKRKTPAPPEDRFLNCPSNLTAVDRTVSSRSYNTNSSSIHIANDGEEEEEIDRTIRVIIGRCNEVCMEKKKNGIIGKKSVSFLVKKLLFCSSGFGTPPITIRDLMQESRMEKLLRTLMLSKKICPQNVSSTKRILEGTHSTTAEKQADEEQEQEKRVERHKWVKTDSECTTLFFFLKKRLILTRRPHIATLLELYEGCKSRVMPQ